MSQELASSGNKNIFSKFNLSSHKGFLTIVFFSFVILFILITYTVVQQQQVYKSQAETNPCLELKESSTICTANTKCTWVEEYTNEPCRKKCGLILETNKDTCNNRIDCEWDETNNICIEDEVESQIACNEIPDSDQQQCSNHKPACKWVEEYTTQKCRGQCSTLKIADNCNKRIDCIWDTTNNICKDEDISLTTTPILTSTPEATIIIPDYCDDAKNEGVCNDPKTNNNCKWLKDTEKCVPNCNFYDGRRNCPNYCSYIDRGNKCVFNCQYFYTENACNSQESRCTWNTNMSKCESVIVSEPCSEIMSQTICQGRPNECKWLGGVGGRCDIACSKLASQSACIRSDCEWKELTPPNCDPVTGEGCD